MFYDLRQSIVVTLISNLPLFAPIKIADTPFIKRDMLLHDPDSGVTGIA